MAMGRQRRAPRSLQGRPAAAQAVLDSCLAGAASAVLRRIRSRFAALRAFCGFGDLFRTQFPRIARRRDPLNTRLNLVFPRSAQSLFATGC